MKIVRGTKNVAGPLPYPVVAIGNFDGVHRGHQIILRKAAEVARQNRGTAIAFTFEPHPLKIIAPDRVPPLLTTFRKKMELIEACGIDQVICADFTQQFSEQQPRDFAKNILVDRIGVKEVVVGFDYAFGRRREGTVYYLQKMGEEFGFVTHVVDPIKINGHLVSSSYVRDLLEEGNVKSAKEFLGRYYSLAGPVVHGTKTGGAIGVPTANLDTSKVQVPGTGVYAVRVRHRDRGYDGVANVGFNPTFNRDRLSVEVHIFDFHERIYHEEVEVAFIERIRDEIAFQSG
ncbi:MAG: bifunctional riboflavin kinase/FAD synthetase, partial [Nitrospinaceae bacterium]|nr:bifunctional riboflavin kinase/FAD synthetase [Nitrospinaceae bacterium]NIS84545.1 bifunctional riboflavin kinase/FAD synthetase [Nitrospinaceae bacterium]NIT81320.1 bifunctional riboflavin kinase/FAD synthetase [Nitrospinaceae bacterium]NIU95743.1 bifunctional riboflavin kinase/FAD synthetase [Nitrospinaceae bacterium]NIY14451.1 bifunctional riboflavin kinase/FAD synthetase [Nitrospinaceae bacterium]